MEPALASTPLVALSSSGERHHFLIQVAAPKQEPAGEWSCQLSLGGLHENLAAMRGEDSLQALCLALSLGSTLLSAFVESGGQLQYPSGEPFPLEAYFGNFASSR